MFFVKHLSCCLWITALSTSISRAYHTDNKFGLEVRSDEPYVRNNLLDLVEDLEDYESYDDFDSQPFTSSVRSYEESRKTHNVEESKTPFTRLEDFIEKLYPVPEQDSVNTHTSLPEMSSTGQTYRLNVYMPSITVPHDDTYVCSTVALSKYKVRKTLFITGYIPHAIQSVAHHMLFYGCSTPGSTTHAAWDCGGTMHGSKKSQLTEAPVCKSGDGTLLWAWAKDAPALHLPEGVGFEIGNGTSIRYLVLQAHFKTKKAANKYGTNKIGVTAVATTTPQPKVAGIYLLGSSLGPIPPHSKRNLDIICRYRDKNVMRPFAFRTHTHALGVRNIAYRVRNGTWTLIGQKSPQAPEAFYPVKNKHITIEKGDWLAARCEMESHRNRWTYLGAKHTDEMCNFYIMYWTPRSSVHGNLKTFKVCGNGYPWVRWSRYFKTVPEEHFLTS